MVTRKSAGQTESTHQGPRWRSQKIGLLFKSVEFLDRMVTKVKFLSSLLFKSYEISESNIVYGISYTPAKQIFSGDILESTYLSMYPSVNKIVVSV